MKRLLTFFTPQRRRYFYRVANAGVGVAVGYGLLTGDESVLWMLVVNAALGMADVNVPRGILGKAAQGPEDAS